MLASPAGAYFNEAEREFGTFFFLKAGRKKLTVKKLSSTVDGAW